MCPLSRTRRPPTPSPGLKNQGVESAVHEGPLQLTHSLFATVCFHISFQLALSERGLLASGVEREWSSAAPTPPCPSPGSTLSLPGSFKFLLRSSGPEAKIISPNSLLYYWKPEFQHMCFVSPHTQKDPCITAEFTQQWTTFVSWEKQALRNIKGI